jgi:hypothetical protein
MLQKRTGTRASYTVPATLCPSAGLKVWGLKTHCLHVYSPFRIVWSKCPAYTEATAPGSSLSSTLPLIFLSIFRPLFPPHGFISGPSLPLPITPLSPTLLLLSSLLAAPPHLAPLVFLGVVSPRLPFPSTMWTLIPPFLMISTHIFLVEVLWGRGWWEFFPCPLFFVVGVLSLVSFAWFLSASTVFFFLYVAFPSIVF